MSDKSIEDPSPRLSTVRHFLDPDGRTIIIGDSERATVARSFWAKGMEVVQGSRTTARRLNESGFHSPAHVWAVRSVEIFIRQCVALCTYYDDGEDVSAAIRKASEFVRSGNWSRVWSLVDDVIDANDPPLAEDGDHAWEAWKRQAVGPRDKIVRGLLEADYESAESVITFAERLVTWISTRLASADRGPLRGLLRDMVSALHELASDEEAV